MKGLLAESRIGSRPSGTNSANPVPTFRSLGGLVESAGVAEGLLHFGARSSFGAAVFVGRRCSAASIEAPIMRSADALPLVICGLDLGAFATAVAKGRDWGAGSSPGGVAPTGSSPICARCHCRLFQQRPAAPQMILEPSRTGIVSGEEVRDAEQLNHLAHACGAGMMLSCGS